jgi:hypothetical protein
MGEKILYEGSVHLQAGFDLTGCAISKPHPDNLGWMSAQDGEVVVVGIF